MNLKISDFLYIFLIGKEVHNDEKVAVIMGNDSDLPIVKGAIHTLKSFGIPVEIRVISAHRSPRLVYEFATTAR